MGNRVIVIGAGFAGMSAAGFLARDGFDVTLLERHDQCGGRARQFQEDGYTFDMGPSWYWMPDVFENWFRAFGDEVSNHYQLKRLDPSYTVWFGEQDQVPIPSGEEAVIELFESIEPGSGKKLKQFLKEAAYKYNIGINDLVFKPGESLMEFADTRILSGVLKLHVLRSFSSYVRKYFKHPKLIQMLEFPVLFLGAMPDKIPALYSLMNYADISLGTWYPDGGMYRIVEGMEKVIRTQGVDIRFNSRVTKVEVENGNVSGVRCNGGFIPADYVVSSADYHHTEQQLLDEAYRTYNQKYWDKRVMAPSCLLWYIGVNKKVPGLQHHNLFFDTDFDAHAHAIYSNPSWPEDPLFYACCPSKTDAGVAPEGKENLFLLVPVAPGLEEDDTIREQYYDKVMDRLESHLGTAIRPHVEYVRSYAYRNFIEDYNAFKGNAYGLANTLKQTANFKPSLRSRKVEGLFFAGQLTLPGPGVPPSLISGQVVANLLQKTQKPIPA